MKNYSERADTEFQTHLRVISRILQIISPVRNLSTGFHASLDNPLLQ